MDSDDDNCLVIDETDTNIDMNKRDENNSSMNGTGAIESPTKHTSDLPTNDATNSPKALPTTCYETPSKSKERHDDKTKSKSDKHKAKKPTNDKKMSPSSYRPQWIRLTRGAFKDRVLNVSHCFA